jgi:hypothetical protein
VTPTATPPAARARSKPPRVSGLRNTAFGHDALSGNSTGDDNTASGNAALHSNDTGNFNTATGAAALALSGLGGWATL